MTELNIAYSYNGNEMMDDKQSDDMIDYQQLSQQQSQLSQQQQPQLSQQQQQPQLSQQQQQPQPLPQSQPQQLAPINNSYYMNQSPIQQQQIIKKQQVYQQRNPEYSFWDRMALSRNDVFKLVLLAFVIVLGISIFSIGNHYLTLYLSDNMLSSTQEFIVRISYPILIFLLLWIIKSL
jgi:hypothetical protein